MTVLPHRPRLALPFTVLSGDGRVRLVAGEDHRFTLAAPGIETWLPGWLPLLDGTLSLDEALGRLQSEHREAGRQIVERLFSERAIIDGPMMAQSRAYRLEPEGSGPLVELLRADGEGMALRVLCQDSLRFAEAEEFNARCLTGRCPWMWVTTGPMGRGYVSPVFQPEDGPCLVCLVGHFRRLSPFPSLYDELAAHERGGGPIPAVPFPAPAIILLAEVAKWKAEAQSVAAFGLHVLETASLCLSSHEVMTDPECPACRGRR